MEVSHAPRRASDDLGNWLPLGDRNVRGPGPETPPAFYYPASGNYATTRGTVRIPAGGYYYNVPLFAIPAPVNPAPARGSTYSSFYYPARSFGYDNTRDRYVDPDAPDRPAVQNRFGGHRPDWLFLR